MARGGRVGAALLAGGLVAPAVPAGHARADTTIEVEIGVNGHAEPGDHVVVRARITADELVDGEIVVASRVSSTTVSQPLQVPAGTTKELLLVVPGAIFDESLRVDVRDGDRVVATDDVRVLTADDVERVGVLPRLATRVGDVPEQVTLASRTGRAELAPLTTDVVELGPIGLEAYDTIVGTGADLVDLDETQRRALLLWTDAGGRLLVDDATGSDVFPTEWRPGSAGYAWAGRGEVRLVDGAAAGGRWEEIIEPSSGTSERLAFGTEMLGGPEQDLAARANVRLPSLLPLVVTLAAYGFVIGPVVYLVLRRSRRLTLGWVVVPLVAVLTATGILIAGGRFRSGGNPAVATFVETSPAGAVAVTNTLIYRPSGGDVRIPTPSGWQLDAPMPMFGERPDTGGDYTTGPDGSGLLGLTLEAGQAVTTTLSGPLKEPGLTVTAAVTDGERVAGSVVNGSDVTMHDVAVFVGDRAVGLGELASGARADWDLPEPTSIDRFSSRADRVWTSPFADRPTDDQLAEFGIWGTASLRWELFPTGFARVVGWTDRLPPPVTPGEGTSSRAAISSLVAVDPAGRPLGAATVRAVIVRSPFGPLGDGRGQHQVVRYLLPPGSAADGLVVDDLDRVAFSSVEFWDGERWIDVDLPDGDEPIAVPPAAVRGGVVLLRSDVNGMADPSSVPVLEAQA